MNSEILNSAPRYLYILLAIWEVVWKGIALWKAAQKKDKIWFVVLLVINTIGILPIIYLIIDKISSKRPEKAQKEPETTKKTVLKILGILVLVFLMGFILSVISIGNSVNNACKNARYLYEANNTNTQDLDCVEMLSVHLFTESTTAQDQRNTIWALGQFGDKRAWPILEQFKEYELCLEPVGQCEYELEKAIKWTSGSGTNILSPIWQRFLME